METQFYDVVIIGGGPAGLSAAIEARKYSEDIAVALIERERTLGGILNQCIHNGFGLHYFKEELTGPEYAQRFIDLLSNIDVKLNTSVIEINHKKELICVNKQGIFKIKAKSVVLAMGCRERTRGAIQIPGTRPSGIFTAGLAQRLINIEGYKIGNSAIIVGSGDIGLIMARRLTLEGIKVKAVVEIMPYSTGLKRNIVQCLEDFNIPLFYSHTVTEIHGIERVEGVTIAKVDEFFKPIEKSKRFIECDTVLLSVGLIPENELSQKANLILHPVTNGPIVDNTYSSNVEGIFVCGNVLHVHDLVDYVTLEAQQAGKYAALYSMEKINYSNKVYIDVEHDENIRYVVPHKLNINIINDISFKFRVAYPMNNKAIVVELNDKVIYTYKKSQLAPGEMEKIDIKKEKLLNIDKDSRIKFKII